MRRTPITNHLQVKMMSKNISDKWLSGIILKGIGGFYYVEAAERVYECKPRGLFRKNKVKPLAGDFVRISINGEDGVIEEIQPRKTQLIRPPIANIDTLMVVVSVCDPAPNILNIDKMTVFAYKNGIEPVVVISKADRGDVKCLSEIYDAAGIQNIIFSSVSKEGSEDIRRMLKGKITAFAGNTGVGKSTLLNTVYQNLNLKTGTISKKLGRGKHTTRSVELFKLPGGGYAADSAGFSTIDIKRYGLTDSAELIKFFPDLLEFTHNCKFSSCSHTCEAGCELLCAIEEGRVNKSRHNSYKEIYNELKAVKQWEVR